MSSRRSSSSAFCRVVLTKCDNMPEFIQIKPTIELLGNKSRADSDDSVDYIRSVAENADLVVELSSDDEQEGSSFPDNENLTVVKIPCSSSGNGSESFTSSAIVSSTPIVVEERARNTANSLSNPNKPIEYSSMKRTFDRMIEEDEELRETVKKLENDLVGKAKIEKRLQQDIDQLNSTAEGLKTELVQKNAELNQLKLKLDNLKEDFEKKETDPNSLVERLREKLREKILELVLLKDQHDAVAKKSNRRHQIEEVVCQMRRRSTGQRFQSTCLQCGMFIHSLVGFKSKQRNHLLAMYSD